jgi:HSP20 family molecular chaperone IbpA
VDFDDRMLRISAERREEKKQESDRYFLSERRYGSTSRSIRLPTDAAR